MGNQPKKYRNFVIGAASAALVASAVAPISANAADFSDVKGNTHEAAINALVETGVIKGYEDGTFKPNKSLTRSDVVKMMGKWLVSMDYEIPTDYKTNPRFTDHTSKTNDELLKYAALVKDNKVFGGYEDGSLGAGKAITRENMAIVLVRAYDAIHKTDLVSLVKEQEFDKDVTDLSKAKAEAREYIDVLDYFDITNPVAPQFNPKNTTTRGQFASFLYKTTKVEVAEKADTEAPEFVYTGETTLNVEYKAAFTAPVVTATDNKDEEVEVTSAITNAAGGKLAEIDTQVPGAYTITYSAVDAAGNKAEDLILTVVVAEPATPEVVSVNAINATQVEVKFNNEVDASTVFAAGTSGTLKSGVFTFTHLDPNTGSTNDVVGNTSTGVLSKDGKTLTITATTGKVFEGRYDVKIDGVKDVEGKEVVVFDKKVLDLGKDTTAPTITGTERISANKVKITFSEPVQSLTPTYTYADGSTVTNATSAVSNGATELVVDLKDAAILVNKEITVTFNGLKDMAGNLVTPQPSTVTVMKEQVDGVTPAISSVTQSGAKTFNIKFNKDVEDIGFTVDGAEVDVTGATAVTAIEQVSASEYKVTVDTNLDGATTVTVKAGKAVDLAGQTNATDLSKVVTFSQDVIAPKVTASKVVVDKNNAEVLELTFDKDVTAGIVTVAGKQIKDYVTTTGISETPTSVYADGKGTNKRVLHVPLSAAALAVEGAAYDVTVSSIAVTNIAGNKAMESVKVQFTRGKDGIAPSDLKNALKAVTPIAQDASINNKVTVEFTENVDGATGTNVANYQIDGAVVESARIVAGSPKIVELTLKADSNTFTGVRNVTVENVKAVGSSVAMDKYTGTVTLKENVAPKVESAVLTTTGSVTLTFSEAVIAAAGTIDFELVIGGKTVASNDTVTTLVAATPGSKTVVFDLEAAVSAEDIAKGLELKPLSTMNLKDFAGNSIFTSGNIKITNN